VQPTLKEIEEIYHAALERGSGPGREAYLDTACGADAALRAHVEALLQANDEVGDFLEVPVLAPDAIPDEPPVSEGPGTGVGRYKLLEKIGEGGMAVVYMAEQTEPIRRKVALKIIKLGMDTRQVIARFEAERQALALMDHPSIAKVLDAGATETGRPYFVMELVQGVSITEYCDANSLSTKDRLHLFLQVCQAVQHAHTKGIIHRDIKPSNVMVTHHDGRPIPKVIDFGIAKATNQKLTEKTLFTRYAHLIGTPAYMSPEQAELSDLDIDTRSDIYSLGVLLYELLTGTTPFSEEELRKAGYIEMQRVIREQEPVKPSTRIKTAQLRGEGILPLFFVSSRTRSGPSVRGRPRSEGETPSTHAGRACPELAEGMPATRKGGTPSPRGPYRHSTYEQVRGDLDWIVMKTLEKDRARRYETASGLAEDIRRHLEHEPVLARGPGVTYRLGKFLRRHRSQVLTALVLAVAAGAAVIGLSQWSQGRRRLAEAQSLRHQAEGLRDKETLSQAREQYAKGDRNAALDILRSILDSRSVGPEARLLQAGILVDNRRSEEAVQILNRLLDEPQEIAGAAHALLARILWESQSLDTDKLKEIEQHRQKAQTLLADTAEAYFLRAMTALTIKEQLAALAKALELDQDHYDSLRLRAFTYYASRKYEGMKDDALGMTYLRRRDPLGYALRAIALRELGKYGEAIVQYDYAMALTAKDSPQYLDLATQRCETLLRMGRYEHLVAAAQEMLQLWPDQPVFLYHLFCARTAVGDFEKAATVFQKITRFAPTARNEFWVWATKYVFDTLAAGRSWHPPDHEPKGAAFLPLVEAEETYRDLSAKAHRVVTNGFSAEWSPDGKKLAFSLGVHGYSGIALYDPATKETELLIVPGKDPRWSPDGRHIAFVRDCQALRLEELTTTERKEQIRWARDEEVWVMNADGTEPRRLARGSWPSWSQDSLHVYFHSCLDATLCSISIAGQDVKARPIIPCSGHHPSVSPDNHRVAYRENDLLKVRELASQAVVAEWCVPFETWGGPAWSPTGQELCLSAASNMGDRTGLWIYRLDSNEPAKVLSSQIMAASWAPDGTKLVFGLRPPYLELWAADLDPAVSTSEALGPGQTLEAHWQDMLRLYARRIKADPRDASAYTDRARYYSYRNERARANADMRRWSALISGQSPADSLFSTAHDFRHAVNMPFDCELVFSAERPVSGIPTISVAFGQKERYEMKLLEIPTVVTSLWEFCFPSGLDTASAQADFALGKPRNPGPPINGPVIECAPAISADGRELYFGHEDGNTRVARRTTPDSEWGPPSSLGPIVDSPGVDGGPCISADGLSLYFNSDRPDGLGGVDIWMATRTTTKDTWGTPINVGATVNSVSREVGQSLSADGLELYLSSNKAGGYGGFDLWVATRATVDDRWSAPVNLGPEINSPANDEFPEISADGLLLLFGSDRPGGYGRLDLYMARRTTTKDPWASPVNLGPTVNSSSHESAARISADGSTLYFHSNRPGGCGSFDIWQAPIIRILDSKSHGITELKP
jgi:serine/threonine protein kinase/Tol biopolymer transport system component